MPHIIICSIWSLLLLLVLPITICRFILKKYLQKKSKSLVESWKKNKDSVTIGFFHPYCNSGGGGERVLWQAISAIQKKHPNIICVVYSGVKDVADVDIVKSAEKRFDIKISRPVHFIRLNWRCLLEAKLYPRFTMIGQSLGSVILAFEAALKFMPTIYFESTGFAFTMPVFRFLGVPKIGCYVHYPTISTDMLDLVSNRTDTYNNASNISKSAFLSKIKLLYYKLFAALYGLTGKCSDVVMVNSSWTYSHISLLWKQDEITSIVYPPCNIEEFEKLSTSFNSRKNYIVSIGQFRPEKDHELQIRSFKRLLKLLEDGDFKDVKLVFIGSCRNSDDEARVDKLKKLCQDLDMWDDVVFKLNMPFAKLKENVGIAKIGLHAMWNEHFGIGVVECMAAGLITVAHDSGGPKMDIITYNDDERTGFLASDEDGYSKAMLEALTMKAEDAEKITQAARKSVKRFSDSKFCDSFMHSLNKLF